MLIAGAIMSGNTVVLKPSELSVACEQILAELIPKYLDTSSINVITGGVETTKGLLGKKLSNI